MLADPQVFGAKSLARTNTNDVGAKYATSARDALYSVSHSYGRRTRHTSRYQFDSLVTNPFMSGENITQSMTVSVTIDMPPGYDTTVAKTHVDAVLANLSASTGANVTKILGGES